MRTTKDRIRHAISFEIIGIAIIIPLGMIGLGMKAEDVGFLAVAAATIATLWNYFYNIGFDKAMKRWKGTVHKTLAIRFLHALLFEGGLVIFTLPLFAAYLGISLWQALVMDIAFVIFYLVYAFVFNWLYDWVFPLPKAA